VEADERVVGADVMNSGIVSMQADGKSVVVEAGESIVVAVVAGDIVIDVQMEGESVMDARENVVDARENVVDIVYADAAVVGVHTDDRRAAVAVVWAPLFWMLAQAILMIYLTQRALWVLKQAVLMVSLIQGKWLCRRRLQTRNTPCSRGKVCGKEFCILGE
jgi:hypothetical protein